MAALIWTEPARIALRRIHEYIAQSSELYADRVVGRIEATVERLQDFPESGRWVPESEDRSLREVIAGAYRVVYRYQPAGSEHVIILAVFHGRQRFPPGLLADDDANR